MQFSLVAYAVSNLTLALPCENFLTLLMLLIPNSTVFCAIIFPNWRASVASETLTGVKMKKSGMFVYLFIYWRASVASETLTGVKMKKSGMFVYLYICMDVRKAFLYFDPRVFVLVRLSTPSQIALNRIL